MAQFIQEVRSDGLYLIDVEITQQNPCTFSIPKPLQLANVMVVSARQYGQRPASVR